MQKHKNSAFTLVELIVVITILAILWTIWFLSLQWYSASSRDSVRINDISSIKTSLELFQINAWKYPLPTNWTWITYQWSEVWNQWTFWETTFNNIQNLDKIPLDPLVKKEYTYSTIQARNEYELSWLVETDDIVLNRLQVNAWDTEAIALVTWNYNGQMAKNINGSTCNMLSIPSIIASNIEISRDLEEISNNKRFVYNWFKNLPNSFKNSKFDINGWFDFAPLRLLAYSWDCNWLNNSVTERIKVLKWLQESYSWSILKLEWKIKDILWLELWWNRVSEWWWTVTMWNWWWL